MQTLLSNFVFVSLSRSLFFVQFGNRVVHFVSILLLCVFVYRPRSVCWHKMKTKQKREKKKKSDPAQTKETNDNSSCWAAHN